MRRGAICLMLGAFALAGPATFAAEQTSPYAAPWPGWHAHGPGFWWIFPLMMLFMFVFFVLVFLVLRGDRGDWRPPWRWMTEHRDVTPESALEILNKRYVRGEIDKEEYEEKKTTVLSADK